MIGKQRVTVSWVSELVGDEEGSDNFYVRLMPRIKEGRFVCTHDDLVRLGIIAVKKTCEKNNKSGTKIKLKANK